MYKISGVIKIDTGNIFAPHHQYYEIFLLILDLRKQNSKRNLEFSGHVKLGGHLIS